jgi:hypothetical protein
VQRPTAGPEPVATGAPDAEQDPDTEKGLYGEQDPGGANVPEGRTPVA